ASAACRHVGTTVDRWIVLLTRFLAGRIINEWRVVRFIPRCAAVLPRLLIVQFVSLRIRRMCARSTSTTFAPRWNERCFGATMRCVVGYPFVPGGTTRPMRCRVLLAVLALLGACTRNPVSGRPELTVMSAAEERRI